MNVTNTESSLLAMIFTLGAVVGFVGWAYVSEWLNQKARLKKEKARLQQKAANHNCVIIEQEETTFLIIRKDGIVAIARSLGETEETLDLMD